MPPKKKKGKQKGKHHVDGKPEVKSTLPIIVPPPVVPDKSTTVINFAVGISDTRSVTRLIEHYNFDPVLTKTSVNDGIATPIHFAAKKGDSKMLKLLLSYKTIDVNKLECRALGGYAAIHYAVLEGHDEVVRCLAESGANLNLKCDSAVGETPLHLCCRLDQRKCGQVLVNFGAMKDARDNFGHTPSFWAFSKQNHDIIRDLNLPPPKTATAEEFIKLTLARNPHFRLPGLKVAKKGGKKGEKGVKKKKK